MFEKAKVPRAPLNTAALVVNPSGLADQALSIVSARR